MERVRKNRNSGLTLIEVMISMLVIMIIGFGAVSYMYACVWNARRADVRITATRVGQLLLETWKLTGHNIYNDEGEVIGWAWSVTDFDPTDTNFNLPLPYNFSVSSVTFNQEPIGVQLGDYTTTIDGEIYFVTLSYRNDNPYMLNARVAWSGGTGSGNISGNNQWVDVTSYAIY